MISTKRGWGLVAIAVLSLGLVAHAQDHGDHGLPQQGEPVSSRPVTSKWNYYALVIGNDNYQFLPKLKTATSDAKAVARVLHDEYGFSTSVLLNATRSDIIDALITYRRKLPENSSLVIYYAGHGTNDPEAKVAYWVPVDAKASTNANWISADDITAELRVIKAVHVLVIADSCYSGALTRSFDDADIASDLKPGERQYYLDKLQQVKSRNVMASGGNEPVADGGGDGHSIFAAVLLQSLRDLDGKVFTASALFQNVAVRVAGRSQQTPQYGAISNSEHDGGDFVFWRQPGKTPPADLCCDVHAAGPAAVAGATNSKSAQTSAIENIDDMLAQYRNAYEDEDVPALQALWPTMKPDAVRNLQAFFRQAKSVQLHTTLVGTPVVTDSSATVSVIQELSYLADGKPKKVPPQKATIRLSRQIGDRGNSGWKIESIQ